MDDDKQDWRQMAQEMMEDYLHVRGLRITPERRAIVDAVFSMGGHFTVEDIHTSLNEQRFRVSLATLYSNLDMLTELGIVSRHYFGPTMKFEQRLGMDPHFHRVCKICGQMQDLHNDRWMHIVERTSIRGFKPDYYQLYVYGTCTKCAAALRRKNKKEIKK